MPETIRDAVLMGAVGALAARRAPPPRRPPSPARPSTSSWSAASRAPPGLAELVERELVARGRRSAGAPSATRSRARPSTPTCPGSQRRALHRRLAEALRGRRAGAAWRWRPTGSARATRPRARDALLRAADGVARRPRPPRRRPRRAPGARAVAGGRRRRSGASPCSRPTRRSAELAGELAEAARAWREICALARRARRPRARCAVAQRRLAAVHDLKGDRESALAARRRGRRGLRRRGTARRGRGRAARDRRLPARRADAHRRRSSWRRTAGEEAAIAGAARPARPRARPGGRRARHARRLRRGARGPVQAGLALALEHGLTLGRGRALPAAQHRALRRRRLPPRRGDARHRARALPRPATRPTTELLCVTCMVYVLRECGEWARAAELGRELIATGPRASWVAEGLIGAIHGYRGRSAPRAGGCSSASLRGSPPASATST